jgi:hypothetical protein
MIDSNKEYFLKPYYFFLAEKSNKLSLYYNIAETITESRKKDEKIDFDKKDINKVKKGIGDILKNKRIKTKDQIKKYFQPINKNKEEIEEFIDYDGTLTNSKTPVLDMGMTPRKTTDQTVVMTRMPNNPVTRGYRKYYGESVNDDEDVVNEVDYSDAFGYEETKDMDGKKTFNYLVKKMGMEPDEAKDRTEQFGKDPSGNRTKKAPKKIRHKKGFIDRMTLSEIEKTKMMKMVEDILNKKNKDLEITEKEKTSSKIIKKNIEALKKMADKEGVTINQLIKMLRSE